MSEQLTLEKHFNTTNESGQTLQNFKDKAENQNFIVLAFFEKYPGQAFTPDQVHQRVMRASPLTSTRRAITTLTKAGLLVKTNEKRTGLYYNRPVHCWTLRIH